MALFKNSLVAFIVLCDIIDSPTCVVLSSNLIMKLLFNNHYFCESFMLVLKCYANQPHTWPGDSQKTSEPQKMGIICIKWLKPKR